MLRNLRHVLRDVLCGRRSISAALIAVYFTTAAGIPLPAGSKHKGGEAYPCADHACGCDSAEQCWRSCCCHSPTERFAWARRHNVRPPEFAIAAAAAEDRHGCCKPRTSCCDREQRTCCAPAGNYDQKVEKSDKTNRIVAWRALGCRGLSMNWLAAVPSLVVVPPVASNEVVLVTWLGPATSDVACSHSSPPDLPPPECRVTRYVALLIRPLPSV
jgi:hypothetical protein